MLQWFSKYESVGKVLLLPLSLIDPNPMQPRKVFDPEYIEELSRSMEENGLLQPITVRKKEDGRFELIAGECRSRAAKLLGWEDIPGVVSEMDDQKSAVLAVIENLQRKNLSYFEEAQAYASLMDRWGLTQQQLAQQMGKSQSAVANKLRLLRFPSDLQDLFVKSNLTERHARALLKLLDEPCFLDAVKHVIANRLNVAQTEAYVEKKLEPAPAKSRMWVVKDLRIFLNTVEKAVSVMKEAGIPAMTDRKEDQDYIEYRVKIPKEAAYRPPMLAGYKK